MSVGLKIEGAGEFLRLKTNAAKLDGEIQKAIRAVAKDARKKLIAALSKPGTGRFYAASKGTRTRRRTFQATRQRPAYRASAPGQAPAKMSGNLIQSVRTKFPKRDKGFSAKVFEHRGLAYYRRWLEFGAGPAKRGKRKGAGGERAPRPVFTPLQKQVDTDLTAAVQKVINNFASL